MSDYIKGKGSELYLGEDATTELVLADLVGHLTNIGEIASEYNIIEVEPELDAETKEVIPGLTLNSTFTVTGNLKDTEDNSGYEKLLTVNKSKAKVKFGIVRPGGLDGVGGLCLINKVTVSEAANEGVITFSADITTSGDLVVFTKPIA